MHGETINILCVYVFHCFLLQTALCSTAIDNPNNLTKFDIVQHIISYLDTDTVLFQSSVSNHHISTFMI